MLQINPDGDDLQGMLTSRNEDMDFYRVLALPGIEGKEVLVCAARQGGLGVTEVRWGQEQYLMRTSTFGGLDVVDVCDVVGATAGPAIAAVSYDGTLLLVRDALHDDNPLAMKFNIVQGTAYRLLSARGHLFLLTSQGLYALMGLGERLLSGKLKERFTTSIYVAPMEAVDANLVEDRWLLVVLPDEVLRFDLEKLAASAPERMDNGEIQLASPNVLEPAWEIAEEQSSRQLATA
jgi:hypothetical protein